MSFLVHSQGRLSVCLCVLILVLPEPYKSLLRRRHHVDPEVKDNRQPLVTASVFIQLVYLLFPFTFNKSHTTSCALSDVSI